MDAKGEVLLTIMASLAQQESESLSKNVKLGLQFRYQNGEVQVNHNRFMGYTKDDDGNLVIEPREAEIVKRIYLEYLQGASLKQIGDGLERDGILTAAGKPRWRPESVKKILTNEKYIGDALLQKTYTIDVLTKKRVKNNGLVPQYYVENSHEAIIPRELYAQVQEELLRQPIFIVEKTERKEFTVLNMHYQAFATVRNVEISTEEQLGTIVGKSIMYGDASIESKEDRIYVMHRQSRKRNLKQQWFKPSTKF